MFPYKCPEIIYGSPSRRPEIVRWFDVMVRVLLGHGCALELL